jgi:16S rRNA (cytosine1402-N4)-methyltransferase
MQKHITVLTEEAVDALAINESSIVVDATLGASGHAQRIVSRSGKMEYSLALTQMRVRYEEGKHCSAHALCTMHLTVGNFRHIDSILDLLHIEKVDAILADLGWRMEQFSGNGKGFSFQVDEELLMTFGDPKQYSFTAQTLVNDLG